MSRRNMRVPSMAVALLFLPIGLDPASPTAIEVEGEPYGVYVGLATLTSSTFDGAVDALEAALRSAELEVLASYEAGVDGDDCSYRAHIFVAHRPEYATRLL